MDKLAASAFWPATPVMTMSSTCRSSVEDV
jgi:hypothetical protein